MLIFVIAFNFSLTVLNLYVAYRLWRWRQYLAQVTLHLERWENYCDLVLKSAPEVILQGRSGSHAIRQSYPQLGLSLAQLQSILAVIRFSVKFRPRRRQKSL
jgi:hypothetical protein